MQTCKCGAPIPLEACPTCPPVTWICTRCGAETVVEMLDQDTVDQILKEYQERHPEFRSRRK